MVLWAFIKVVSLGYILGMVSLSLATLLWKALAPRIAPAQRADCGFTILISTFALNSVLTIVIFGGVVSEQILMTTNYFHRLMYGGWGLVITIAGGVLLGISLLLVWLHWRRGHVSRAPETTDSVIEYDDISLRISSAVATISLVGAWRPELWVNQQYWDTLSDGERKLALAHEAEHRRRRDNMRRLLVMYVTGLYMVLPWMRGWPDDYGHNCEMAVDDACRRKLPADKYLSLVLNAMEYMLTWKQPTVASHLSQAKHQARLQVLSEPRAKQSVPLVSGVGAITIMLSIAPAAVLLFHPVSRCLCACYLGY